MTLLAIPIVILVAGLGLVATCQSDCWDRGGGLSVFAAFMTGPGALLGGALVWRGYGKGLRMAFVVAGVLYALLAVPYTIFLWQVGLSFLAVAILCAAVVWNPRLTLRRPAR